MIKYKYNIIPLTGLQDTQRLTATSRSEMVQNINDYTGRSVDDLTTKITREERNEHQVCFSVFCGKVMVQVMPYQVRGVWGNLLASGDSRKGVFGFWKG